MSHFAILRQRRAFVALAVCASLTAGAVAALIWTQSEPRGASATETPAGDSSTLASGLAPVADYQPVVGDVLFQSLPQGPLVNAIEGVTESPFSHCGIVAREESGEWIVYEALVSVRATPLSEFLAQSRDGACAAYRLKEEHRRHIPQLLACVREFLGRPYDSRYRMDDEKIYCSELIFKAYQKATGQPLGKPVALGDMNWKPYATIIRLMEKGRLPLDREMITPRDLSLAEQLERVGQGS